MSTWKVDMLTIFPEMFPGPLGLSIAGKALERGLWTFEATDIRELPLIDTRLLMIPRAVAGLVW